MISKLLFDHPAAAGENYFEHMGVAFRISARLLCASAAAFVHGVLPGLCETTASTTILKMTDEIHQRRSILENNGAATPTPSLPVR